MRFREARVAARRIQHSAKATKLRFANSWDFKLRIFLSRTFNSCVKKILWFFGDGPFDDEESQWQLFLVFVEQDEKIVVCLRHWLFCGLCHFFPEPTAGKQFPNLPQIFLTETEKKTKKNRRNFLNRFPFVRVGRNAGLVAGPTCTAAPPIERRGGELCIGLTPVRSPQLAFATNSEQRCRVPWSANAEFSQKCKNLIFCKLNSIRIRTHFFKLHLYFVSEKQKHNLFNFQRKKENKIPKRQALRN